MKNKGFTLIELLGVIVILSILSIITIPIIDNSLNKGKENMSETQKQQLIKGLKDYYADPKYPDRLSKFNEISTTEVCKKVYEDLQQGGYLPADIVDPKTNDGYTEVCVKKAEGSNKYEYRVK